jgi:hypothetical protein
MKSLNKIISGLVIAVSIVSTGAVAMAAGTDTTSDKSTQDTPKAAGKMMKGDNRNKGSFDKGIIKNGTENNLKALVSAGVITQEEADKIPTRSKQEKKNPLAELVDDGTLTQAQLDEVAKVVHFGGGRRHGGHGDKDLSTQANAPAADATQAN